MEEVTGITTNNLTVPNSNKRLYGSLNKLAEENPDDFVEYYSNEWLHKGSQAWLGPIYQIISEVNVVVSNEGSQMGHRDYPLGFYSKVLMDSVPSKFAISSQFFSLQAVVIHHDTPIEMGPTRFLFGSQKEQDGYTAFRDKDFQERFKKESIQIPLKKGDLLFYSPATFHGAGANISGVRRLVNLFQISCAFLKPLAHLNFVELINHVYPALLKITDSEKVERVCRVITDSWPFPTNFIKPTR